MSKNSTEPLVSVVIRAFNEEKHLGALLTAIQQQSIPAQVILVDSGSTDRTLAIAKQHPVNILHIKPKDFTFGRALNLGIAAATSEIVVFASAHVLPIGPNWLKDLVAPFSDPKMALAYGAQRGAQGTKFSEAQHFLKWFPQHSDLDQYHGFSNNANAAVRKALWQQNPFDEKLTGLEDVAWGSWALHAGHRIAYVAEAGVFHIHDESNAQIVNRHRREALALRQILPASRFTPLNFASLFVRSVLSDFGAALKQRVLLREAGGIITFRFLQYLGTYRGYRDPLDPDYKLKQVFYYPPGLLETRKPAEPSYAKQDSHKSA
jgi:glycosyltransferase involved in cell wall biosynthesis